MTEPNLVQVKMLAALNNSGKHIYAGTANRNKVAKARRRTKLAKASRKANRSKR